jgi:microcystin-dependent protein
MSILVKGTDFGATEQVTSTKLDNLVDAAKFTDTSETAVSYTGSTGTCLQGGGLEVTSAGQLHIQDGEVDLVKFSTALKDSIHPVGIILETTEESTAAAFQTKIGFGTWEAYGSGRVTVAIDSGQTEFDTIGETGGANTVTLTNAQIPGHTHTGAAYYKIDGGDQTDPTGETERTFFHENSGHTKTTGNDSSYGRANLLTNTGGGGTAPGGGSHNNLQPYIVVYRYRRTA